MFAGEQMRKRIDIFLDQGFEVEHHAGAALRIEPRPLRESLQGGPHRLAQIGARSQRHARLYLAGRRIEHIAEAPAGAADMLAADEMRQGLHGLKSFLALVANRVREIAIQPEDNIRDQRIESVMDTLRRLAATRSESKRFLQLCKIASLDHEMKLAQLSRTQTKLAPRQAPFLDGAAFGQVLHISLECACEYR